MAERAANSVLWRAAALVALLGATVAAQNGFGCPKPFRTVEQELVPRVRNESTFLGQYVKITKNHVVAGGYGLDNFKGVVEVWERNAEGGFQHLQQLRPRDPQKGAHFGLNLHLNVDVLAVSAPYQDKSVNGVVTERAGAAYVFDKGPDGRFTQSAQIFAYDAETLALYAYSVFVAAPNKVLVGSKNGTANGQPNAGAVYVYRRPDRASTFNLIQKISGFGGFFGDELREENGVLLIGAPRMFEERGRAYVYLLQPDGSYSYLQSLYPNLPADFDIPGQNYGEGIAIGTDAQLIVVGGEKALSAHGRSGSAHMFQRGADGKYTYKQPLEPPHGDGGIKYAQRLDVVGDTVVVNAWRGFSGGPSRGKIYMFRRCSDGVFRFRQGIALSTGRFDDMFAKCIDMQGNEIVAGATRRDSDPASPDLNQGAVFVFKLERVEVPS